MYKMLRQLNQSTILLMTKMQLETITIIKTVITIIKTVIIIIQTIIIIIQTIITIITIFQPLLFFVKNKTPLLTSVPGNLICLLEDSYEHFYCIMTN